MQASVGMHARVVLINQQPRNQLSNSNVNEQSTNYNIRKVSGPAAAATVSEIYSGW